MLGQESNLQEQLVGLQSGLMRVPCVGFFCSLFPLIQGAADGVVSAAGQHWNSVVIGLGHYILGGTGAMKFKGIKEDLHISKPTSPVPSCLSSSASICSF